MAHQDWDLFAIVRSCKAAKTTTETPPTTTNTESPQVTASSLATFSADQENDTFSFPNLVKTRTNGFQELHQLFTTLNPTTTTSTSTSGRSINPNPLFSDFSGSTAQQQTQQHYHHPVLVPTAYTSIGASTSSYDRFHHQQQQQPHPQVQQPQLPEQQQQQTQPQVQKPETSSIPPNTQSQTPRPRKRKIQQKKMVCHVTADNISADLWAWRKYGQKPIKGSPYPRNYYRCSSCKGCAARKQVERSTIEPNMFIVTYTGDHKHAKPAHRNSLAGSTRNKPSMTRLPAIRGTGSDSHEENTTSSNIVTCPKLSVSQENMCIGVTCGDDKDQEPDIESDEDDVLIPNTAAMSDAVFLGSEPSEVKHGSDPNRVSGSDPG